MSIKCQNPNCQNYIDVQDLLVDKEGTIFCPECKKSISWKLSDTEREEAIKKLQKDFENNAPELQEQRAKAKEIRGRRARALREERNIKKDKDIAKTKQNTI